MSDPNISDMNISDPGISVPNNSVLHFILDRNWKEVYLIKRQMYAAQEQCTACQKTDAELCVCRFAMLTDTDWSVEKYK